VSGGAGARGLAGPDWAEWAKIGFSIFLEFPNAFLFIFSIKFNSNSTTIQIQIIQTCASNKRII
jgi:energy-converting hydrogenase Eha subunit G